MKSLIIYFNKEKTAFQVVKPTEEFNGDWAGLARGITKGVYQTFKVI